MIFFPPRAHLRSDCRRSKRVYHYPRTWSPYQVLFSTFLHSCHFLLLFRSPSAQVDLARLRMGSCLCPWPFRPVEVRSAARATPRACFVFPGVLLMSSFNSSHTVRFFFLARLCPHLPLVVPLLALYRRLFFFPFHHLGRLLMQTVSCSLTCRYSSLPTSHTTAL